MHKNIDLTSLSIVYEIRRGYKRLGSAYGYSVLILDMKLCFFLLSCLALAGSSQIFEKSLKYGKIFG